MVVSYIKKCDLCGKEWKTFSLGPNYLGYATDSGNAPKYSIVKFDNNEFKNIDLCENCINKLDEFLANGGNNA